jgi:tripartite-type tricarboxylate transporter receptor subunit TctC
VIVENRPGAGGIVGASVVAKSTPDGHTLFLPSGAFTANAASVKNLPYDAVKDFQWITVLLTYPFVLIVRNDSPNPRR